MAVIIDRNAPKEAFRALEKLNIKTYLSCSIDGLYKPVNTHPDMQIHIISEHLAVVAPCAYEYYKSILPGKICLVKGNTQIGGAYPCDCAYNVAKLGKYLIGNLSYVDTKIKEIYQNLGFEFVNTKQGYTKCNLFIVDEKSAITEDEGIYRALKDKDIDILKIPSGTVCLKNFPHGFIGGATGFIKPNTLGIFGDLSCNPAYQKIFSFVKSKSVDIIYLLSSNLIDFGSILYFDDNF